jgi:hypothetical protein
MNRDEFKFAQDRVEKLGGAVSDNARVNVAAVINDSEISRFQYIIFALCILIIMCDGFDTQALAYVAPSIASEWKLSPGSFGPVFAAVLLGSMAGAFALDIWRTGSALSARCCCV